MAQTSTTILASKSHKANVTGTDISFTATGNEYKISATSTTLNNFAVRDLITVTGTTNNNSTFTVKTVQSATELIVEEIVTTALTGAIKMQGSLATTPTEDDWFDISGTTFTTDQSTTISSSNFTGNFVWVRAKATSVTDGTISSSLLNH